jgi:hypothetical protein
MFGLSFDVGQKNLAFCKVNLETHDIVEWNVISLPTTLQSIVKHLEQAFPVDDVTLILVEKQPARNVKMRIIETILMTYFLTKGIKTVLSYSAKHKLGSVGKTIKGKTNYTMRKKMSVVMCKTYISRTANMEEWIILFDKSKKKDDLSDSLLQYLSYIKYDVSTLTTSIVDLGNIVTETPNGPE